MLVPMPYLSIDPFDNPALWQALDPALAASVQIVLAASADGHPYAQVPASLDVAVGGGSLGHRLRRVMAATDLRGFGRVDFWFRSDVALRGLPEDALRVRLRLGSVAMPLDSIGNTWSRYLVGPSAGAWNFAAMGLGDLPVAIAAAVTQIEFQIAATDGAAHSLRLDGLMAAAPQMTVDVDQALLNWLDGVLMIGGAGVPVRIAPAVAPEPYIRVAQWGARRDLARDPVGFGRIERDDLGMTTWAAPEAWELIYRFEPQSAVRGEQAAMLDFLATRLDQRWMPVGNRVFRVEKTDVPAIGDEALALPPMRYMISAWAEPGAARREAPVSDPRVAVGLETAGA